MDDPPYLAAFMESVAELEYTFCGRKELGVRAAVACLRACVYAWDCLVSVHLWLHIVHILSLISNIRELLVPGFFLTVRLPGRFVTPPN